MSNVVIEKTSKTLPPLPDAETLYHHWVYSGLSLRKIGRIYGRSRTTIWQAIRAKYGKDACNPKANGLARVVAQEYGEAYSNTICKAHGIPGRFLTRKKEQNLTTYQAIDFLDNFPVEQEEVEEGLRLTLFIWFSSALVNILVSLVYNEVSDNHSESLKELANI